MLSVEGVSRHFGGLVAVSDVTLAVPEGAIVGLIGPNGAGKTTLFSVISGFLAPTKGRVAFEGVDITHEAAHRRARRGIARTFQIVQPFAGLTVRENIAVGAYLRHARRSEAMAKAEAVAERVGLGPMLDHAAAALTVAGRKRLELARALATEPRLLLLDEVLAGLNPSEIRDILPTLRSLREHGVTILMIEHVMQAVMALCEQVYVLSQGELIASGSPGQVCREPAVVEAYLGKGMAERIRKAADA